MGRSGYEPLSIAGFELRYMAADYSGAVCLAIALKFDLVHPVIAIQRPYPTATYRPVALIEHRVHQTNKSGGPLAGGRL